MRESERNDSMQAVRPCLVEVSDMCAERSERFQGSGECRYCGGQAQRHVMQIGTSWIQIVG
jgi:hypothetical protein